MVQFSALSMAALSVFSLAAVGGGVSYAAKDAQPGDFLYSVHTTVYGDVRVDAEEEMNDMQKLHDDLLDLQLRGEWDADAREKAVGDYTLHLQAVEEVIAELEADGHAEQAASLRAALEVRAALFISMMNSSSASSSSSSEASSSSDDASFDDDEDDEEEDDDNDNDDDDHGSSSSSGVHIESEDSASFRHESEDDDSSVRVNVKARATSTVNIQ